MNFPNLLFLNNDNYLKWCNSSYDWKHTRDDLNFGDFLQVLKLMSSEFPDEYLCKPCFNIDDVKYRLNIMSELFLSPMLFSSLSEFSSLLKHFRNNITEYRNIKDENQKKYYFLLLCHEYGSLIKKLNKYLTVCSSEGLSALFNYTDEIISGACAHLFEQVEKLKNEISLTFNSHTLSLNPNEKTITVNKEYCEQDSMKRLSVNIKEYFGIKINDSFSIVDPSPISVLEKI